MAPTDSSERARQELLLGALRSPRGRYKVLRAAQLSGVPRSTVYDWARDGVLVPDYPRAAPMAWSYRDLVYLRLLARMRHQGVERAQAAESVLALRKLLEDPAFMTTKVVISGGLFVKGTQTDLVTGQAAFAVALDALEPFDLTEPLEGVNSHPAHGPDLVEPSRWTYIAPSVMGGEPCIIDTRIPSATIASLTHDRKLRPAQIVRLYPQLTEDAINDAVELEASLSPVAVAA